ncbi:MAG: thioester reductase-like protein [Cyclobacteriaceae bacterium]|jgi:thioester reductase-like protein
MRHLLFSDINLLNGHISLPSFPDKVPTNDIENKQAFITGATGFIGGFLLKELLQNNRFESYICLVRADTETAGYQRVKEFLLSKGTPEKLIDPARIKVVIGDVLKPQLGLNDSTYQSLLTTVDHVFHFAASMNWVTPFNQDSIANIEALKTVIKFCGTEKLKKLHYASSMGIWTLLNHTKGPILETEIHHHGNELPGGYFQSKWVNEQVLKLASAEGIPVNVYRIGDVKGNSEDGLGDPQNFGNLVMQYFINKGVVIDSDTPEFNFIPVDYLAKSIAYIAINSTGNTHQFTNPELISFCDIYAAAKSVGHDCKLISKAEWIETLKTETNMQGKILKPIFKTFTPDPSCLPTSFYGIGVNMFKKKHDTTNTDHALSDTNFKCPAMLKDGVLKRYLIHLGEKRIHL